MPRVTAVVAPVAHLVGPGKLKVINGQLAFTAEGQGPMRLDPTALRTVMCYGKVSVSDAAFELLFRHDAEVAWLTPAGTACRGRLVRSRPERTGLRLLHLQSFERPERRLEWAKRIVAAKVQSQIAASRHYQRHGRPEAGAALPTLHQLLGRVPAAASLDSLRGLEGSASGKWFSVLSRVFQPPWRFEARVRRPPTDPINALLSLGYTWLLTRAVARCESAGLEVYVGALHDYRPGRPSLACDLIEPFRIPAVDRWVVNVCHQAQVAPSNFVAAAEGGIHLQPAAFGRMLHSWESHWVTAGPERDLDALVNELVTFLRANPSCPGTNPTVL